MNNVKHSIIVIICSILIAAAAVLVNSVAFMAEAVENQAEAEASLSIYEQTDYDYIVMNPSADQITEFSSASSVLKAVPFYNVSYSFSFDGSSVDVTIKSIDNADDLSCTEFAEERLVKSSEVSGNAIYIDYSLSKRYGIEIGDEIGSGEMTFTVAGLYQTYDISLAYVPAISSIITTDLSYGGVYIQASDKAAFKSGYLDNYVPLATLKGRESFSDDAAYSAYLETFYAKDYSSYITEKTADYDEAVETSENKLASAKTAYLTGGIISGVIVLAGMVLIVLVFIKKIRTQIANGGRSGLIARYAAALAVCLAVSVAGWFIAAAVMISGLSSYISVSAVLSVGWAGLVLPVIGAVAGFAVDLVFMRTRG